MCFCFENQLEVMIFLSLNRGSVWFPCRLELMKNGGTLAGGFVWPQLGYFSSSKW